VNNLGQAFVEILPNLKKWGARLKADIAKASNPELAAGERKFSGFATRVKDSLFSIKGAMGVALGGAAIGIVTKFGLGTAAALQQAQISFETLLGSATKAKDFLQELKSFAATTPFELQGVVDASRQLLGAGAAAKDVVPTLKAYGDASGALGLSQEQFGRIMLAVTQSMTKGKLQAEELMQITEAGIPVYSLLSKALGLPVAKIQDLSSKGKLLAADVLPKLQAQMEKDYGGAMAKQSQTLTGLWSTLTDTFKLGLSDALQPLIPTMGTALPVAINALAGGLKAAGQAFGGFIDGLKGNQASVDTFVGRFQDAGKALHDLGVMATDAAKTLFKFYEDNKTLVETTTGAIIAMFIAFKGYQAAVAAINAVNIAMLALRASVISTTAAMAANPFGIIALAVVGLVTAFVIAYKRSETFRNIVNNVWASVKSAVSSAIAFLTPYFNSFVDAMKQVGQWATWLWHTVLVPAFNGIMVAVRVAVQVITVYINIWMTVIRAVAAVIGWLYSNVVKPIFTLIGIAVRVWVALFKVYVGLVTIVIKVLGQQFVWLYQHAVAPYLRLMGAVITWLYQTIVKPVFSKIGTAISVTWKSVIKPTFDLLRDAVQNKIAPAFKAGVSAMETAWNRLKDVAKAPVKFVVNTIINSGIIDTYNKLAGVFGVGKVGHVSLPKGFAAGGKFDTPTAIVGEGNTSRPEYVIPTDPRHRNRALALYSELGTQLMAEGGILGKVKGFAGNVVDLITNPKDSLKKLFSGALGKLGQAGSSPFAKMIAAAPLKLVDGAIGFLSKKASGIFGGVGGGSSVAGSANARLGQALAQSLYGWIGGQWTALNSLIQGESGWRNTAQNPTSTAYGIFQFLNSTWAGVGATKTSDPRGQIIAGLRYIKQAYGSPANAYAKWLSRSPHWYDQGGVLPPGVSMAVNGTRKAEVVSPVDLMEQAFYNAFVKAIRDTGIGDITLEVDGEEFKKVIRVESKKQINASSAALKVGRR
jgi:tape measure domain-containing protein